MTLTRTSRIMLGFLLLALAAFLWVNFLVRGPGLDLGFLTAAPAPSPQTETVEPEVPAVAPAAEQQVERELEILELPFLVTEPPPAQAAPAADAPQDTAGATAETARRATVNPFSPIIRAGAGTQAAPAQQAPSVRRPGAVTEVPVPSGPARGGQPQGPQAPRAPAPEPMAPDAVATASLPQALPGGTLGGMPEPLRNAIGARDVPEGDPARLAAVREPEEQQPRLEQLVDTGATDSERLQPLAQPVSGDGDRPTSRLSSQAPLVAGTSPLSRYLRDNNFRFTGSVIGPVSVGVFRSSLTSAPVVISLGQTLPDTSIVLTDLRGQQAELTLGEKTQVLTLELRR